MQEPRLVGYGVDTLILNMRYTDEKYWPIKKELSEEIAYELMAPSLSGYSSGCVGW